MSKHTTDTAAAVVSPKVKSAGVWGAVITGALIVVAAFLQSVPAEALAQLGPWAAPVGAAVATGAAVLAAYAKGDPLRNLGGAVADLGGTVPPAPTEVDVEEEPLSAELPEDVAVVNEGTLTPEADALAAKAAARRQAGGAA